MPASKFVKALFIVAVVCICTAVFCADADAQCAMCRAAVQNASNGAELIRRLNLGILVLLAPPAAMFCGIFGAVYRYRNTDGNEGDKN